jgi:hypothetical protein
MAFDPTIPQDGQPVAGEQSSQGIRDNWVALDARLTTLEQSGGSGSFNGKLQAFLPAVATFAGQTAGGASGSPAAVGTATQLSFYEFQGYNGTAYASGATIQAVTAQAWTASAQGTQLEILTCATGANALIRRMWIGPSGGIVIGNPAGGDMGPGTINVAGNLYINGAAV